MNHSQNLLKNGYLILKNIYDNSFIKKLKKACIMSEKIYLKKGGKITKDGIVISHPFIYDQIFLKVISNNLICEIIENSIGDRITLTNSNINNRQIKNNNSTQKPPGSHWHTDSRYVQNGKIKLPYGSGYLAVLCIDDFNSENGATEFVPKSHLLSKKPDKDISRKKYDIDHINLEPGDMFIFDSGLWHKAGKPSLKSRWGIFNFYSPWYIKPYYRFYEMFKTSEILEMDNRLIDLLHFSSLPPISQLERVKTVMNAEEVKEIIRQEMKI